MTTVGFIGSGNLGGTVARLTIAAAYDVVLRNSRGPQTLTELVEEFGAARGHPGPGGAAGELVV
jgi:predicted dinucleotide-binding enzyme